MNHYHLPKPIDTNHILYTTYGDIIGQLLINRGIEHLADAEPFMNPRYEDIHDPFLLYDMEKAITRLYIALACAEKITIYADYDADGVPGSVVLANLLEKIGYTNFDIYIPHRHDEGYGIHIDALEKIADSGTRLIITIDVGITAHDAALWCQNHAIDLIITDHHVPLKHTDGSQSLPNSFALINPKQDLCSYPDPMLCGCGVIFKYVQAFIKKYGTEYGIPVGWEKWLLDLVGISTISDMVPLRNENRLFAHFGMKVIQAVCTGKTRRPGLKKMIWASGINSAYMTEEDISFTITPKINAASRMSHPQEAVAVFRAQNEHDAEHRVKNLEVLNKNRKKLTKTMIDQSLVRLAEHPPEQLIVIGDPNWQTGVLGLVASKLVNEYRMPVFVWSQEGDMIKGSCRSCDGQHLVDIMQYVEPDTFVHFGGHAEAGGFTCVPEQLPSLETQLKKALIQFQEKNTHIEKDIVIIDRSLSLDDITVELYTRIRDLAPFGMGNPKPLFLFHKVMIYRINHFGKNKEHLEIFMKNSMGKEIRGIAFFTHKDSFKALIEGTPCDVIAHIEYSVFMGTHELRLKIIDIQS